MTNKKIFTSIDRMFTDITNTLAEIDRATIVPTGDNTEMLWGFGCVELDTVWLIKLSDFNRNIKCPQRIYFKGSDALLKMAVSSQEAKIALAQALSARAGANLKKEKIARE